MLRDQVNKSTVKIALNAWKLFVNSENFQCFDLCVEQYFLTVHIA